MTVPFVKQLPLTLRGLRKEDLRTQFAALCYRVRSRKIEILLITSRRSGRWIVPKGWPSPGLTPADSALQEAWEEAGVIGTAISRPLGMFSYVKVRDGDADDLPCVAMLYPVKVKSLAKDYPESKERRRKWVSRKKASSLVDEPELARMLRDFDPRAIH